MSLGLAAINLEGDTTQRLVNNHYLTEDSLHHIQKRYDSACKEHLLVRPNVFALAYPTAIEMFLVSAVASVFLKVSVSDRT